MTKELNGLLVLSLLSGCELLRTGPPEGRPVVEAYGGSPEIRVLDVDSPMRARRRIPVLSAPQVFAAYIPAHVDKDLMIGDHWIYFRLKEAQFFIEEVQDPDVPIDGKASPEHLKPLGSLEWDRVIVPHQP